MASEAGPGGITASEAGPGGITASEAGPGGIQVATGAARAIKIGRAGDSLVVDEFAQLARLAHAALPQVYEVGRTDDGSPCFVARWIGGGRADARRWDRGQLIAIAADLAGALAAVHAAGLVHGDVAPQNVLVDDDPTGARVVLVDLGLATGRGARGTPAYMAPEAFAGDVEPRSDLWGLGAVLVRLATGAAPFGDGAIGDVAMRALTAPRPVVPELGGPLGDLVGRLLAVDVDARPASAAAVVDELAAIASARPPAASRARVVVAPAPASWPGCAAWLDDVAARLADGGVEVVVGDAGSGARELVAAAVRRWQLARVARGLDAALIAGSLDVIAAALDVGATGGERGFAVRVARALRAAGKLAIVDLADDPRADELLAALAREPAPEPVIGIVDVAPRGVGARGVPRLDDRGAAELAAAMLGAAPPAAWARELARASDGGIAAAIELVRAVAGERAPYAVELRATALVTELRARGVRGLTAGARAVAAAVAAWGGRVRVDRALATARAAAAPSGDVSLAAVAELERGGLARRSGHDLIVDEATAAALGDVGAFAVAGLALAGPPDAASAPAIAALLAHAPVTPDRARAACEVADQLLARGRADRARALAERAAGDPTCAGRATLVAALAAAATGAYADAIALARDAARAGADPIEAELVAARAAQRAGDLDAAEVALAALHAAQPAHDGVAGAYARLLVTRSRYADARAVAAAPPAPLAGLRAEAAGLAAFYAGDLDDADRAFAALELSATAAGDSAAIGRALSLRGMVAQQRGQLGLASERYRDAARRLGDVGEVHAAAVAELNLGTTLAERGRASEALPCLASAARVFADVGATTERVAADLNRGNALLAVGQLADARVAADAALAHAAGAPHLHAFALLVAGDARRRLGGADDAARCYRDALALAIARDDAHALVSAMTALAEAGIDPAQLEPRRSHAAIAALCPSPDDRDRWTLARARLHLVAPTTADASGLPDGDAAVARACADVAARARAADRLERAFRAHALASRLADRARDAGLARGQAELARSAHAAIVAAAAPAFRAAIAGDPDLVALPAAPAAAAALPPSARAAAEGPHLRRLLALSRRLNTEADVSRILDEVLDTAIELTAAERGFLLLRQADGELHPVASRNFAAEDLAPSLSRSIAERAAQSGEPVITVDAGVDERFGAAASVAALRLRSVLVVPLRQRGGVIGCIYVDHRLRGGAFDDTAAATLSELADLGAIAIENARLAADLRRTTSHNEALAQQLASELAERDAELVRTRAQLPDRDRLRHRFERIVGRAPVMVRMLELVERAAATALPVVIVGESGTGKELVARALHDHGARAAAPFVALNCSAVPEPLLESELFGHARGAFTGAERDRRGLFEVADGGTLFLDEIADTGAAMQSKLLRVLQDGVIRRVGDSKTRRVDVRVVVATQRPLAELAAAGTFRDDLRYRLEVIAIPVPPLRDRDGDLPLLVDALLAQLCAGRTPPRLTRAALRALSQHRWPGNVRELENALARGVAMGGDGIDLTDLPETIAGAAGRPEPAKPGSDDLRLRPALAATEQAYIAAAMTRAKGNQTVAARLLGLSRFGLQKKLRRLGPEAEADDD
nr:sigma 54-interacting transcriptional regulator [Kofleriaceae bacterium]